MKRFLNYSLQIILAIISICFFTIVVFFTFRNMSFSYDNVFYIGGIMSFLFSILFRKKKAYFFTAIILVCVFFGVSAFKTYNKSLYKNHTTSWNDNNHTAIISFYGSKNGHLFIKTKINDKTKYLGFDTGADISGFNEKYIDSKSNDIISIRNSQDEKHFFGVQELQKLSLGNIEFKNISYIPLGIEEWENSKGIYSSYENKDSIAGILGNNIINSFVWDFNMNTKSIKIIDEKFSENISNATIIPLIKSGNSWEIEITVNEKNKRVKLDSGSNSVLTLKESLNVPDDNFKISSSSIGINSSMNNSENRHKKVFMDLKIGDVLFKKTLISCESKRNLLGVPLFWEYDRIVLDFIDHKMYVFEKSNNKNRYSISNISKTTKKIIEKIKSQKPVPNNVHKK